MVKKNKKPEVICINANRQRLKPKWHRPTLRTLPLNTKRETSLADLEKLEDAIFNHGAPYRIQFLQLYKPTTDFEAYLKTQKPGITKTLKYCWEILKWRPNNNASRVIETNNP